MKTTDKIKMFESLYHPLTHDIESDKDLKRYGLTLTEYNHALDIILEFSPIKGNLSAQTIMQNVANLFKKYGFTVKEKGIGWIISFE